MLLFVFGAVAPTFSEAEPPNKKLKIGIIAPLSGGVASWGRSVRLAIEIANKESKYPAELYFEDEETCVPKRALSAYRHLRSVKQVDVIVTSCLEGGQAIAPLARKDNVPFFISGRSSHEFQKNNSNALSWLSLLDYEGEAVADLVNDKKWTQGSTMVWSGYFGVQFAAGIRAALEKTAPEFEMMNMEINQGTAPTGAEVQRLIRNKPDAVFLMMSEPAAAYVVKQLKAINYQGEIVLQSSMLQTYDPEVRKDFEGALQQKFPVDPKQFVRLQNEIKTTLGEQVADDFVFSFDGFSALLEEGARCGSKNSDLNTCLSDNLRDESWRTGASGKFRFMKDGSTQRPMVFKTITRHGFSDIGLASESGNSLDSQG